MHEKQRVHFARLCDKLTRLQEANTKVTSNISNEEGGSTTQRLVEVIDAVQDLSMELLQMVRLNCSNYNTVIGFPQADKMDKEVSARNVEESSIKQSTSIQEGAKQINAKILELRRLLSYICAASGKVYNDT